MAEAGDLVAELLVCGSAAVALIAEGLADHEAEAGDDQRPHQDDQNDGWVSCRFLHVSWGVLTKHAVDSGAGDAVASGQLAEALAALPVPQDGGRVELEGRHADVPAFEPGGAAGG